MIDFDTFTKIGDLSKLVVAKRFKKSPKVQKIAKSGHTGGGAVAVTQLFNSI